MANSKIFFDNVSSFSNSQVNNNRSIEIQNEISKLDGKILFNSLRLDKIEKELVDINKYINQCIDIVDHSSKLSIKRNKNIIKLHGTLRGTEDDFGFDNDPKIQYIIAKEDYETYPIKHEAFTQLMRISLLQESYCLIGFSGVDPNFIEWVKWVRDILEKGNDKEDKNYKIYLIDFNDIKVEEDVQLFYKNHKIYRIPLFNQNAINFLETETGFNIIDKTNRREVL